jgi:hypothetical protein
LANTQKALLSLHIFVKKIRKKLTLGIKHKTMSMSRFLNLRLWITMVCFWVIIPYSMGQGTFVSAGITYGTSFEYYHVNTGNPGIQLGVILDTGTPVQLVPSLTWMFPNTEPFFTDTRTTSLWETGVDAHYTFWENEMVSVYGSGGLHISFLKSNYKGPNPDFFPDYHDNALGIVVGGGVHYKLSESVLLFFEGKYVFRVGASAEVGNQFFLTTGVRFNATWLPGR